MDSVPQGTLSAQRPRTSPATRRHPGRPGTGSPCGPSQCWALYASPSSVVSYKSSHWYFLLANIRTMACSVNRAPPRNLNRSLSMSTSEKNPHEVDSSECVTFESSPQPDAVLES